jgi:gentisate 1,2-dioxygenase
MAKENIALTEEPVTQEPVYEWSVLLTDDQFYPKLLRQKVRPAKWSGQEVRARLQALANDPLRGADRRFVALINQDCGTGASPGLFIGIQIMNPGEHIKPHRHNSVAIYHITQGQGYSLVADSDGNEFCVNWETGDTFSCPAWYYHEHFCTGEGQAIMYVVQDMVALAELRALIFEEPMGMEHIKQVQEGFAPHIDTVHED